VAQFRKDQYLFVHDCNRVPDTDLSTTSTERTLVQIDPRDRDTNLSPVVQYGLEEEGSVRLLYIAVQKERYRGSPKARCPMLRSFCY
jgi:hypothetical protein